MHLSHWSQRVVSLETFSTPTAIVHFSLRWVKSSKYYSATNIEHQKSAGNLLPEQFRFRRSPSKTQQLGRVCNDMTKSYYETDPFRHRQGLGENQPSSSAGSTILAGLSQESLSVQLIRSIAEFNKCSLQWHCCVSQNLSLHLHMRPYMVVDFLLYLSLKPFFIQTPWSRNDFKNAIKHCQSINI